MRGRVRSAVGFAIPFRKSASACASSLVRRVAAPEAGSLVMWSTSLQPPSCSSISYLVINGLSLYHFQINAYRIVVNGSARPSRSPHKSF